MNILETFETFRGDTFIKEINFEDGYKFKSGDIIKIAVIDNMDSNILFEDKKEFVEETESYELKIVPEKTRLFPIRDLLLEIEVTIDTDFVHTSQYILDVKEDGIV